MNALLCHLCLGWVFIYGSFIFYHKHIADLIAKIKNCLEGGTAMVPQN